MIHLDVNINMELGVIEVRNTSTLYLTMPSLLGVDNELIHLYDKKLNISSSHRNICPCFLLTLISDLKMFTA